VQRDILKRIRDHAGEVAIVSLSMPVYQGEESQVMVPLRNAATLSDLVERENRLAGYYRAHPKVRVLEQTKQYVELEAGSTFGAALERLEALAWFGFHLALFESMNVRGLRGQLPGSERPDALLYERGAVRGPVPAGGPTRWRFAWNQFDRMRDVLAPEAQSKRSGRTTPRHPDLVVAQVQAVVREDPARRWTLADAGGELAMSGRALQRTLLSGGTTFSSLADEVRVAEARRLLVGTALTVAEVAYLSGFSDLDHMRRRFKELYRTTPSIWRANQA
jgi:AraC-like DNA-binding protein